MAASYPSATKSFTAISPPATKSFTTKQDSVDTIQASHINDLQDEVVAIGTELTTHASHINDLQDEVVAIETQLLAAFQSFTPTWTTSGTAPTLGNATLAGRYWRVGNLVWFTITFVFGSTSNAGTGTWSFGGLPVSAAAGFEVPVTVRLVDTSASAVYVASGIVASSTVRGFDVAGSAAVTGTVPFTWATGDQLLIAGCYIAA